MVGKPKSCSWCRQTKRACNRQDTTPDPCSRCLKYNVVCKDDKNFRRILTRPLALDIIKEIHNLHSTENDGCQLTLPVFASDTGTADDADKDADADDDADDAGNDAGDNAGDDAGDDAGSTALVDDGSTVEIINADVHAEATACILLFPAAIDVRRHFVIEDVSVPGETIVNLFRHFERHYLHRVPFLQPIQSAQRLVNEHPLLFWTIITIASQHSPTHHSLYARLQAPHRMLISRLGHSAINAIEELHAVLLHCLWPTAPSAMHLDVSWSHVALAVATCVRMTLYRDTPERVWSESTRTQPPLVGEDVSWIVRKLTWLSCFEISTQVAMFGGFIPPLAAAHYLKHVRRSVERLGYLASLELRARVAICEAVCNFTVALEDADDPPAHLAMSQTFDEGLVALRQAALPPFRWPPELDIEYHGARVFLYSMALLLPTARLNADERATTLATLLKGLGAASEVSVRAWAMVRTPVPDEGAGPRFFAAGTFTFAPKYVLSHTLFASALLFHVVRTRLPLAPTHRGFAMRGMEEVRELTRLLPVDRNKDMARAAVVAGRFVDRARGGASTELVITNRLGASLMWDLAWHVTMWKPLTRSGGAEGSSGNGHSHGGQGAPSYNPHHDHNHNSSGLREPSQGHQSYTHSHQSQGQQVVQELAMVPFGDVGLDFLDDGVGVGVEVGEVGGLGVGVGVGGVWGDPLSMNLFDWRSEGVYEDITTGMPRQMF